MKQKDILIILIPVFIITILWVIFSIYHNYVTSTIKDPLTYQIIPIDGSFNTEGINMIKSRKNFDPAYTFQGTSETSPTPTIEEVTPIEEEISVTPSPTSTSNSSTNTSTPTPTDEIIPDNETPE